MIRAKFFCAICVEINSREIEKLFRRVVHVEILCRFPFDTAQHCLTRCQAGRRKGNSVNYELLSFNHNTTNSHAGRKIVSTVMPALADLFGLRNFTEASAKSGVTCTEDKKLVKLVENFGFPFPLPSTVAILSTSERKKLFSACHCVQHL